jgi:hypothetical protein
MLGDLARALDPALIALDVGMTLDDWQASLMRSTAPRVLLLASRQSGKSTVVALVATHTAATQSRALVLLISPSQRQSGELFRKVLGFIRQLPDAKIKTESALRVELANGSRIVALPGEEGTIRGFSAPHLIIVDEAARAGDDLYTACRPMLATNPDARLLALSTPFGKRGWFHDAWHGDPSWFRVSVPASQCPRISAEFLAEELRELGAQRYSEEYELAWLEADGAMFDVATIENAFSAEVLPLWM